MKNIKRILLGFLIMTLPLFAAVDLSITGNSTMERNSVYTLSIMMNADAAYAINVFESRVTYDGSIFENLSIQSFVEVGMGWETVQTKTLYDASQTTANASLYFIRANTQGVAYSLPSGTTRMYTLSFRIKDNAPEGTTYLGLVDDASFVGSVTGARAGKFINITKDNTAPYTSTTLVDKNYYKNDTAINFSTNEEQQKATINYTIIRSGESVDITGSVKDPITNVAIAGRANDVVSVTVNYQSDDWAGNSETPKTKTCVIDREIPTINGVSVIAVNPVGIGNKVTVNFSVFDSSQVLKTSNPIQVKLGGNTYQVADIGCNGTSYSFVQTIIGNETDRAVVITVTDKAGNSASFTVNEAITFDFTGPEFTIIASPNPLYAGEELTITVSASEDLKANPEIFVGVNPATFKSQIAGTNIYNFSFIPSTNGFGAGFGWLGSIDNTEPYVTDLKAVPNSSGNPLNQIIHFRIADYGNDISTQNLVITVNNEVAVVNGIIQTGFVGRIKQIFEQSFDIFLARTSQTPGAVTVNMQATDTSASANLLTKTYAFDIGTSTDVDAPTVNGTYPAAGSTKVPYDTEVILHLTDTGAGVALDTIDLYISNIMAQANVSYNTAALALAEKVKAIEDGIAQPGFTSSIISDGSGGYIITVTPDAGFKPGTDVSVSVNFADLTITPNTTSYGFDFITLASSDGTSNRTVKQPLAYPTIFDPDKQDTKFYFDLKEPTDVVVKLYDISGALMWEKSYTAAVAGSHFVTWDGTSTWTANVANGVYLFYITDSSKKVLGRGKVIIMRAARE